MAYYAYDATRQVVEPITDLSGEPLRRDGVGAYYAYDATREAVQPINGLALGASGVLSDGATRSILGARRPVAVVGVWGEATSDLGWQPTAGELTLLPITPHEIKKAARLAGNNPPTVAVFTHRRPGFQEAQDAFGGTPYVFERLFAVYRLDDRRKVPRPYFLILVTPRDALRQGTLKVDTDGGNRSVRSAAAHLGGRLVYAISLEQKHPPMTASLTDALAMLPPRTSPAVSGVPRPPLLPHRVHTTRARPGISLPAPPLGTVPMPVVLGVGAVCAGAAVLAAMALTKKP